METKICKKLGERQFVFQKEPRRKNKKKRFVISVGEMEISNRKEEEQK